MTAHDKVTLATDAASLRTLAKLVEKRGRHVGYGVDHARPDPIAAELRQIAEHLKTISKRMQA